jgi:hypothetical protein
MPLQFEKTWRLDSPGGIGNEVSNAFSELIGRIAGQRPNSRKSVYEHFKSYFAGAAGRAHHRSSDESWAESDLSSYMGDAAKNAPLFIESMYDACLFLAANEPELAIPDYKRLNKILYENDSDFEIEPPNLLPRRPQQPIAVVSQTVSLDEQALGIIQRSLATSETLINEGKYRQAVQELLWLLETVSTAFNGISTEMGTVQGKYFNKIVADLRNQQKGKTIEQVLNWITTLHGYLSSPTGGGVRHGTDIQVGIAMQPNEARLYCDLIRSYISFMITEHERLSKT